MTFPFLYCLLLGSAWSVVFRKKFSDSLAPALMLHMILVMLCGMVFHKLSVGIYGGMVVFAGALAWRLAQERPDMKALARALWDDGVFVLFVLYLLCFFSNFGKRFIEWDEFNHWGMFLKESLRLDMLYAESPLPLSHKDYVPATTLFEVIWCRLSGRFLEADAYRAIQMVMFAMLLPMFNSFAPALPEGAAPAGIPQNLRWAFLGRGRQSAAVFFVMLLLLLLCRAPDTKFYHSIYTDYFLGLVFFYCAMQAWHDNENKAYQALVLALGFATLLLTKQTGIMLLPLVFALYVVKLALFDAHGAGEWSCAKLFAVACAAVLASVLVWYSFNLFVDAHVATDSHQSYSGFRVARVIDAFKPADSSAIERIDEFRKVFAKAIFLHEVLRPIPFVPAVAIISWLVFVLARGREGVEQQRKVRLAGHFMVLSALSYIAQMYILYAVAFSVREYLGLASYNRYMATMLLPITLLAVYLYYETGAWKNHMTGNYATLAILAACSLFLRNSVLLQALPGSWADDYSKISDREYAANRVISVMPEHAKMYVVKRESGWSSFGAALSFYAHPRIVYTASVGPNIDQKAMNSEDMSPEQLHAALKSYDYLYFHTLDDAFVSKYSSVFDNPDLLKNDTIYKIAGSEGGVIALKRVAGADE
ncbi:MAG: hypothetical protein IJM64_07170 [Ottowia sp.]|nr:hypothetical protein [Ottowia sp.]